MDWYPWHFDLYRADTLHLTLAEDGAYRRLIDEYMRVRGPLPADDRALARILGIGINEWKSISSVLLAFFEHSNGMLQHKRCNMELDNQDKRSRRRSEISKKAASKRWNGNKYLHASGMLQAKHMDATGQDKTGQDSKEVSNQHASPGGEANEHKAKEKSNGTKRGSRIPPDWKPDADGRAVAEAEGYRNGQVERLADCFRDFWASQPGQRGVKLDWAATWRNYVRGDIARRQAGGPAPSGGGPMGQGTVAAARRLIDRHRRNSE